ncbi:NAD-binding protein [Nocardia sp. CDC159]|uniref:NAD-binding protein n=1 Tax=Nocardia pulmonis TaxID=2951408 RepID=A0A9X2EDL0_9NOCA|nr:MULTISPECIES: NAD(P)-binding protein [Nocardia]MCM6778949.1 NAD-binding protein [Nocardia pulmonis]MCM6791838.1 NAD-binding protein [Nocardia sp. CDC159]
MRTVVVGYDSVGRCAAHALRGQQGRPELVVIDHDRQRLCRAADDGARVVRGSGDRSSLLAAGAGDAVQVVVSIGDDRRTAEIVAAVREINDDATLCVALDDSGWRETVLRAGADRVVVVGEVTGALLGAAVRCPGAPRALLDLLAEHPDLAVTERTVRAGEIGGSPADCGPLVLAVLRDGMRWWPGDPAVSMLCAGDRLLTLSAVPAAGR